MRKAGGGRKPYFVYGCQHYPNATSILILCDGGGSNSSRYYIFKQDLQALADEIGVEIRIAHYPPYCSKYNSIEHRFFPHVTRACQGVVFTSIELVKELMEKTSTTTGLKAFVHIIDKVYYYNETSVGHYFPHHQLTTPVIGSIPAMKNSRIFAQNLHRRSGF